MNGSYVFLFHLLGFGLFSALLVMGWILEKRFRLEPDWDKKRYILSLMGPLGILGPVALLVLLLTGIGNIHNRFMGSPDPWYSEGWLVWKIILFVLIIVNGAITGRLLMTKRTRTLEASRQPDHDSERVLSRYNRWISLFYISQVVLLVAVVYLAVFGGGKHPGVF